jgi:oligopeptide/dipeptide ABC transporter ATP-binding protein
MAALLEVADLHVSFRTEGGVLRAVDGVSFAVNAGQIVAVVGESGSGKSVMAMTLLGLTRGANATISGTARFADLELVGATEAELRTVRGARIAMIFQNPMTALNPVQRIGKQIAEQVRAHEPVSRAAARARAVELLTRVGIPQAATRVDAFPHELSGGMRQRAMIALALSCGPRLLIADEPTTALDVTIQAQILAEIEDLREETGVAVVFITHDLGVVSQLADQVLVMYGGRIVEDAPVDALFDDPQHPYTWGLLGSAPSAARTRRSRLPTIPGTPPSLLHPPAGCHFAPRCPHAITACAEMPALESRLPQQPRHFDRCWLPPADKRRLRVVNGEIGLAAPEAAEDIQ